MAKSIGIDVGGTNLRIGVFEHHCLLQETRFQTNFSQLCQQNPAPIAWQKILQTTAEAVQDVLMLHPEVEHVGIGFPGFIDPETSTIVQSPNLPGLQNVNLAKDLAEILQKQVVVENDALAAAYGEYCLAGKPAQGLIYLGLGTGLGGGLIYANQPFSGSHGVAMEVGHIIVVPDGRLCGCGNRGCVEQYASASGISLTYFESTQQKLSAYEVAKLAENADRHAIKAYQVAAEYLAQMLASVMKILDVPNVVIGGGVCEGWHLMQTSFNLKFEQDLIPVLRNHIKVSISGAGDIAGMLGVAMMMER
ncbi:MAG TPA: glucokinase [Methylophilaceae bacterium]|nr:glucokinase [Methylophilaceae bacterium]